MHSWYTHPTRFSHNQAERVKRHQDTCHLTVYLGHGARDDVGLSKHVAIVLFNGSPFVEFLSMFRIFTQVNKLTWKDWETRKGFILTETGWAGQVFWANAWLDTCIAKSNSSPWLWRWPVNMIYYIIQNKNASHATCISMFYLLDMHSLFLYAAVESLHLYEIKQTQNKSS